MKHTPDTPLFDSTDVEWIVTLFDQPPPMNMSLFDDTCDQAQLSVFDADETDSE